MPDSAATPHPPIDLSKLLAECELDGKTERISDSMVRLRWGSAMVIVGIAGAAIVVIAPLFPRLPEGKEEAFCRRLLELGGTMGGIASFAIQADGWVVLHAGRGTRGLDANELAVMIGSVGRFADQYDDELYDAFYKQDGAAEGESAGAPS